MTTPFPFTRLLIPYDGSPSAKKGLEWAAHLARAGGRALERLSLLRVIGGAYLARHIQNVDLRVTRMDQVAAWRRIREHYLDHEILPLLAEGRRLLQEHGVEVPIDTRVAEGRIGEEILRLAGEEGYDVIVMGRRGLSPVKGFFLGSVTRQVLSAAQRTTVFVVGPETVFPPDCPVSPLLLPVDGSDSSGAAVRQGAALAQAWLDRHPRLELLHVIDQARVTAALGEASSLVDEGEGILAAARRTLLVAGFQGEVETRLKVGDPSQAIAREAEEGGFALILMGARGLSPLKQLLLGSVTNDVLHRVTHAVVGIVFP